MDLEHVYIENFKGVASFEWSLLEDGRPLPRAMLVGDNASGKTTVLQAVALVLVRARQQIAADAQLAWHGFDARRLGTLGQPLVRARVRFSRDELADVRRCFDERDRLMGVPGKVRTNPHEALHCIEDRAALKSLVQQ